MSAAARRARARVVAAVSAGLGIACALSVDPMAAAAPVARPAGAHSAGLSPALARLDADAAIWLRVDAADLEAITVEIQRRLGWAAGMVRTAAGPLAALGEPLLSVEGWRSLGLDPTAPAMASIGAIDERVLLDAAGLRTALIPRLPVPVATGPRGAPAWRSRIVIPVADEARVRAAAARLLATVPSIVLVDEQHAAQISVLVGDAGAAARLARSGAIAIAIGPRGGLVIAHLDGRFLTVDEIVPVHARLAPARVDALLARRGGPSLRTLADEHLTTGGVSIVVDPVRLTTSLLWADLLATRTAPTRRDIELLRARCDATAAVTARGTLGRLGLTAHGRRGHVTAAITWIVGDGPLARVLGDTRDPLLPRAGELTGVDAALSSFVASWAPLSRLPGDGFTFDLPPSLATCTSTLGPLVATYGWPHQIGALLRHLGRAEPSSTRLLAGLGPVVAVIHRAATDTAATRASLEVAVAPEIADELARLADGVWGAPQVDGDDRRWGDGPLRAFARTHGPPTAGLASGDADREHLALRSPATPIAAGTVFRLQVSARLLAALSPVAAFAATVTGDVAATARWDGALRIDVDAAAP